MTEGTASTTQGYKDACERPVSDPLATCGDLEKCVFPNQLLSDC